MAISQQSGGSWSISASTSTMPTVTLASTTVGDLNVILIAFKQIGATFTVPTGWTQVLTKQSSANGAAYGTSTGDVSVLMVARVFQAGDTAPTLAALTGGSTTTTTGNVVAANCRAYRGSGGSGTYDLGVAWGAQSTAGTNWASTYTLGSTSAVNNALGIYSTNSGATAIGDVVVALHALTAQSVAETAMSFSQTSGTFSAITVVGTGNTPGTAGSATGADIQVNAFTSNVTAAGAGVLTAAATAGSSTYGMRAVLRVREGPVPPTYPPQNIHLPNPAIPASYIR